MSYTDLRDFEPEYTETFPEHGEMTTSVEKMGGGTVGRKYTGLWRYVVTDAAGVEVARGQDFTTGMPHTHAWAARAITELVASHIDRRTFEPLDEPFRGYVNQETWAVSDWLNLDDGLRAQATELVRENEGDLRGDALRIWAQDVLDPGECLLPLTEIDSLRERLGDLSRVNWREVAQALASDTGSGIEEA